MKFCRARPYEGKQPYIFFSYNHENADRVFPMIEKMAQEGIRVWYDNGLRPGDDWPEVIAEHLDNAAAMVVAVSKEYVVSHNCCNELTVAVNDNKPIVSVVLDDITLSLGMRMQLVRTFNLKKYEFPNDKVFYEKLFTASVFEDCRGEPIPLVEPSEKDLNGGKETESDGSDLLKLLLQNKEIRRALGLDHLTVAEEAAPKTPESAPAAEEVAPESPESAPAAEEVAPEKPESAPAAEEVAPEKPESAPAAEEVVPEKPEMYDEGTVIEPIKVDLGDDTVVDGYEDGLDDGDATVMAAPKLLPSVLLVPEKGKLFEINKTEIFVGRDSRKSQIAFPEESLLSRPHVRIMWLDGKPYVSDCKSKNGTTLDGEALLPETPAKLKNMSVLRLYELKMIFLMGPDAEKIIRNRKARMLQGLGDTQDILLRGEELHVHRSSQTGEGLVSDKKVSREHAKLTVRDDKVFVTDIGSSNGTYINGRRLELQREYPLESGMELRLGTGTTVYRYVELKME